MPLYIVGMPIANVSPFRAGANFLALKLALTCFADILGNKTVQTNNTSTMYYLNKQGSTGSLGLYQVAAAV